MVSIPQAWCNAIPALGVTLAPDLPSPRSAPSGITLQIPPSLVRQELTREPSVPIPPAVLERYRQWRPTPLVRAHQLESALGTGCRLYYKYEGGNISGSHKLNTAVAQAYYYHRAGATYLTVGTGAGQWGTAVAAACAMFGMKCRVYMVRSSYEAKPHRRTIMEMLGATVIVSPSSRTAVGRAELHDRPDSTGSLSLALAEALEDTAEPGTLFCTGSGETYSLLHQTVIGLEAQEQLAELGDRADVVIGSLGGGSNFGGLALPFLGAAALGGPAVRCVSVESMACPKLTRGHFAYDFTDASGLAPLQKMYTLGHSFAPPSMHAGGLRYHGTAKLISALYDEGSIDAAAYSQRDVFGSAVLFARTEGTTPAPESAHAIHGATMVAAAADRQGVSRAVVFGVSGHGMFDMAAYRSYLDGTLVDSIVSDEAIARSLADLPPQPAEITSR